MGSAEQMLSTSDLEGPGVDIFPAVWGKFISQPILKIILHFHVLFYPGCQCLVENFKSAGERLCKGSPSQADANMKQESVPPPKEGSNHAKFRRVGKVALLPAATLATSTQLWKAGASTFFFLPLVVTSWLAANCGNTALGFIQGDRVNEIRRLTIAAILREHTIFWRCLRQNSGNSNTWD